jgi:hypothetical protein
MISCVPPERCQCEACAPPDTYPAGPPQTQGHRSIRFGDGPPDGPPYRILLNGEDVSSYANEACPGYRGFVCLAPLDETGHIHRCRTCGQNVCYRVVIGRVEVQPWEEGGA